MTQSSFRLKLKSKPIKTGNLNNKPVNTGVDNSTTSKGDNTTFNFGKSISIDKGNITQQNVIANKNNNLISKNQYKTNTYPKFTNKEISKIVLPQIKNKNYINYSVDKLNVTDVTLKNNSFNVTELDQGISAKRPELLMVYNFSPLFIGNPNNLILSDFGKLLEVQYQTSYLKRDIIGELTLNIQNSTNNENVKKFGGLVEKFNKKINNLDSLLGTYVKLIQNKNDIQKYFNLKLIKNINTDIVKDKSIDTNIDYKPIGSIKDFFINKMGYNEKQFLDFTNTKIFMQLIFDLKNIIENYSFNLLNIKDLDRANDKSITKLDTSYSTTNDDFTFNVSKIRSISTPINAINKENFNKILSSLPSSPSSRIKLLLNLLSKEYIVSSELGDPANKKLLNDLNSNSTGSPFDNILGNVGKTIFDAPSGNSLLSLSQIKPDLSIQVNSNTDEQNYFILPFEDKFIDFEQKDKSYVPGKYYFVDSIFETKNNAFNILPLLSFEQQFSKKFAQTKNAIITFLQLDTKNILDVDTMFYTFLASCYSSISGLSSDEVLNSNTNKAKSISNTDVNQSIIAGIYKLATEDLTLKNNLFQFLLLSGLNTNTLDDTKVIWKSLIDELETLDKFSALNIPASNQINLKDGPKVIKPQLIKLAKTIEDRVIILLNKSAKTVSNKKDVDINQRIDINSDILQLNQNSISKALLTEANGTSNSNTFNKEFLNLANKFTKAASIKNNEIGFLLEDKSGRTRFNFISTTTQLLIIYEIFINFIQLFTKVELVQYVKNGNVFVKNFKQDQKDIFDVVTKFLANKSTTLTVKENIGNQSFKGNYQTILIQDIINKLRQEENIVIDIISILEAIKNNITKSKEIAESLGKFVENKKGNLFVEATNNTPESENFLTYLDTVQNTAIENSLKKITDSTTKNLEIIFRLNGGLKSLNNFSNETQLRNSAFIIDDIKNRALNLDNQNQLLTINPLSGLNENIIVSNELKPEIKNVLTSYFAQSKFTDLNNSSTRIKLFSVGLPNNFIKTMIDKINIKNNNDLNVSNIKKKQSDVFKIKLYKRNMQFDDLVFIPKEFIFDGSLYVTDNDIINSKPSNNENFDNLLDRISVTDFESITNKTNYYLNKNKDNKKALLTEEKYSFLSELEKIQLFKNHISSALIEKLLFLATGIAVNEEHFLTREEINKIKRTNFDKDFENILKIYLRDSLGETINIQNSLNEIEKDFNVSDNAKNIIKNYRSGNILCNPDKIYTKAFGQKFFDRIFHLPVDIDDFEIDMEATRKTQSGKKMLNKTFIQQNIILSSNEKYYLKKRNSSDLILEDFFVAIEEVV